MKNISGLEQKNIFYKWEVLCALQETAAWGYFQIVLENVYSVQNVRLPLHVFCIDY